MLGPVGEQAEVPITGNRDKKVRLRGAEPGDRGRCGWTRRRRWNQAQRSRTTCGTSAGCGGGGTSSCSWTGAARTRPSGSRALAAELGVELRFLPTACPELNPLEGLWREVKGRVLANEPTPDLDISLERAIDHLMAMTGRQRRQTAGVLSENFWLPT